MVSVELLPTGERAVLAETADLADALALHRNLEAHPPAGIVDLVPAARTVLVTFDPALIAESAVRAWLEGAAQTARTDVEPDGPLVEVPIRYDGADLADTAALLGVSSEDLAARHLAASWTVAFTGFAPGFAYLASPDWTFDVPRLGSPRTRVPAGAVGLAAGFTGAYPRESPGGWRLIGTTDAPLFDPAADPPVLLPPGARVRFVEAEHRVRAPSVQAEPMYGIRAHRSDADVVRAGGAGADAGERGIRVIEAGLLATVQDLGRSGRAAWGISRSGALDRTAHRRAQRLVGNPEDVAGLEITLGGFRAVAGADLWIALTGAVGPAALDGRPLDRNRPVLWPAGAELDIGWFTAGARAYLAVRGGVDVPPVAGSRATDTLAGLGPARLATGDVLPVGESPRTPVPVVDLAPWSAPDAGILDIALAPGPRADWFSPDAVARLYAEEWTVSAEADRAGVRLDGPELPRVRTGELASEGMVPGAVQVPPMGGPVVFLADGPVSGGYPVIAVVADESLDLFGQAAPGTRVRFRHARRVP